MDYTRIQKDFQTMTKDTQKLIDKYNKSVQSIKNQELAIDKLKNKINEISSNNKTPSSLNSIEKQIKADETEAEKLKEKLATLNAAQDVKKQRMNKNSTLLSSDISPSAKNKILAEQFNLDGEYQAHEKELDTLHQKYDELISKISESKTKLEEQKNILKSTTLDELNSQLDVAKSKLQDTKDETNELGEAIKENMNENHTTTFGNSIDKIGDKLDKFKTKLLKLVSSAMVFSLIRKQLTSLRSDFVSMLKANNQFSTSLNQIKANLMTAFAPIYNACLPAINSLMNAISKVTGTLAVFVSSLFGQSIKDSTKQAKKLSSSLDKVSKSGKKASGSLSSIDTLEVIQTSNTSSSGTEIDYNGEITYSEKLLGILNKIKNAISSIINFIKDFQKEHGTLATAILVVAGALTGLLIIKTIKKLFFGIGKAVSGVSADFTGFFNGLGNAATSIAILGGLALVISSITTLIDAFGKSGLSMKDAFLLVGGLLLEVAAAFIILQASVRGLDTTKLLELVVILGSMCALFLSLTALIDAFGESGLTVSDVTSVLLTILTTIVGLMASITILGPAMTAGLAPFLVVVAGISAILLVMAATLPTILEATGNFIQQTAPSLCLILTTIGNLIENIILAIGTTLPPIVKSIGTLFSTIFNGISKVINSVGNVIVKIMNTAKSLVNSVLSAILNFINKLGPAINNFVDNAIKAITKLINFMISGIEYLVNTLIVAGINKIIKSINSISKYVDITIPTVSNMSIPRFIPKLATGAVIPPRQEFMAILGDQKHGTNIEAPLDTIKQANREVLSEFLGNIGINGQDREIVLKNWQFVLQLGKNRTFAKMVIDEIKEYEKETNKQFLLA